MDFLSFTPKGLKTETELILPPLSFGLDDHISEKKSFIDRLAIYLN